MIKKIIDAVESEVVKGFANASRHEANDRVIEIIISFYFHLFARTFLCAPEMRSSLLLHLRCGSPVSVSKSSLASHFLEFIRGLLSNSAATSNQFTILHVVKVKAIIPFKHYLLFCGWELRVTSFVPGVRSIKLLAYSVLLIILDFLGSSINCLRASGLILIMTAFNKSLSGYSFSG